MKELQGTLTKIGTENITTRDELSLNSQLYAELFIKAEAFISGTVFRSRSNIARLKGLRELGVDTEDVKMECLKKIITNLDRILAVHPEGHIPYMFSICNNHIIDTYNAAVRDAEMFVSIDKVIDTHKSNEDSKKSKSYIDCLATPKTSPEDKYIAKSDFMVLLSRYSDNADNMLCIIAKALGDKPADLAKKLIIKGSVDKALEDYRRTLADYMDISVSDLPLVSPAKATGLSKILRNSIPSQHTLSTKISNILNRMK